MVPSDGRIVLVAPASLGAFAIDPDPRSTRLARRLDTARRMDALPRAIGLPRSSVPPHVVDATAGLGRDAMVLARLGCTVTALERVPALAFLLHTAARATGFAERLLVVAADARQWLADVPRDAAPEVVYLDPMFVATGSAAVTKEMQASRALAGPQEDPQPLLQLARAVARARVVVKRHRAEPPVAADVSFAVRGERVRFDVYLTATGTRSM